jgi:hypothetical protein
LLFDADGLTGEDPAEADAAAGCDGDGLSKIVERGQAFIAGR